MTEYERLMLIALAETIDLLREIAYSAPHNSGMGGRAREVADALRKVADAGAPEVSEAFDIAAGRR